MNSYKKGEQEKEEPMNMVIDDIRYDPYDDDDRRMRYTNPEVHMGYFPESSLDASRRSKSNTPIFWNSVSIPFDLPTAHSYGPRPPPGTTVFSTNIPLEPNIIKIQKNEKKEEEESQKFY
jgi:hypothetical protein